jgi:predicted HAD superfamily Cof-like phosphohydrolase
MKKQLELVTEFHKTYQLPVRETPSLYHPIDNAILRHRLMEEENKEYLEAVQNNNLVEVADALGDMLYVLCGTILDHGLQHKIEAVFEAIHKSNMSKLDKNGQPIYRKDGKVIKGPDYFKPDIARVLKD